MTYDYKILKYPRTPHLQGSRLQAGDEDLSQIPFEEIFNKNIVVEEKIDGANSAISFDGDANLLIQSRGHYLIGGYRERHYNLLKQWANLNRDLFFDVLGERYIMFGEWMYAKHTVFYDALPDYFMEFDIFDRQNGVFLDTPSRKRITEKLKIVSSVPVLKSGVFTKKEQILSLLTNSNYITTNHLENLKTQVKKGGYNEEKVLRETDPSMLMEGLYIKMEENGEVKGRYKYVRASFLQCVNLSEGHWQSRPIIPNLVKNDNNY